MIFLEQGSIAASQIYGRGAGSMDLSDLPGDSEAASNPTGRGGNSPAMFYVGLIVLLVLIRFAYEYAK